MDYQKMTSLTKAGGCGCKISPKALKEILKYKRGITSNNLIVGNEDFDDAAVYQIKDDLAIVSTVDFFSPIVDDPFIYGEIAAANAISDVYAMGGRPFLALSVLGIPSDLVAPNTAAEIIEGAINTCNKAGVILAGGHTIENPQPIFGLVVNGSIEISNIKRNNQAKIGNILYLTKPLGVGILSTAIKIGKIKPEDYENAISNMTKLNSIGAELSKFKFVTSMTDVTGYGLLGHLIEICKASCVSAKLFASKIPVLPNVENYISEGIITSGGKRNWNSYGHQVIGSNEIENWLYSDPQTNGGLLICVDDNFRQLFEEILTDFGLKSFANPIGQITEQNDNFITLTR